MRLLCLIIAGFFCFAAPGCNATGRVSGDVTTQGSHITFGVSVVPLAPPAPEQ